MEAIKAYFTEQCVDIVDLLTFGGVALLALLVVASLSRFIFGSKSTLTVSTSSAIGILFILALTVVIKSMGVQYDWFTSPLPFVEITKEFLYLFDFRTADYTAICSQILSMIILSFLVNLADRWLPKGKNILTWLLMRSLTVLLGMLMHLVVIWLFTRYLPQGLVTYAPTVLLGILVLLLATGSLKFLVGLAASTVHPVIGGLYTFFFANAIGKLITRAILTTALLAGLLYGLLSLGITSLSIAPAALMGYIPFMVALAALWLLVGKVF